LSTADNGGSKSAYPNLNSSAGGIVVQV
jgi:hypothetical protein